ncbi:solute carrier family 25 member 35-like [Dermacentor albipictus]|uniref:solute carrier family 25 member 35-like n=1 Tax=Dermacentor albipictus TaxID=60249 RepID=UPI0031FD2BE1
MRPSPSPNWNAGYAARRWPHGDAWTRRLLAPLSAFLEAHANEPLTNIVVGAIAACSTSFVTHPIEVAKLRIQLQGELQPPIADRSARARPVYRNTLQSIYTVYRHDGVFGVYRGLSTNLVYQLLANGLRLGIYQISEDLGFTLDRNLEPSIRLSAVFGGVSGALGAFVSSPLFLLKTHQQLYSSTAAIAVGYQHGYGSALAALVNIYKTQGVWKGLWRATSSNVLRLSTGSALQMSTFSGFKSLLNTAVEGRERYFFINTLIAAFLSGLASAPFIAVLDVLRARMYAQPSNPRGEGIYYNNIRDCVIKVKQTEGLRGLSRGVGGAFFYTMTSSVLTLVSWEEIKKQIDKIRQQSVHDVHDYGIH